MTWFRVDYMKRNRNVAALGKVVRRSRGARQQEAAQALAEIGDGEAARMLLQLAASDDIAVWETAQRALMDIRS